MALWRTSLAVSIGLLPVLLAGCSDRGGQRSPSPRSPTTATAAMPPARPVRSTAATTSTASSAPAPNRQSEARRQIDLAERQALSSARADVLAAVAGRGDLTEEDQLALIDAACRLGYSEHVTQVFLALAANAGLAPAAEQRLKQKLDCIAFSRQRQDVLDALGQRGR